MRAKDAVGRYGEDVAVRHLTEAGLRVLTRNWRCRQGELDIVAMAGDTLVVVEVKTRSSTAYGTPAEAVTAAKARRLRELALRYLTERQVPCADVRFDVVAVLRQPRGAALVEHLPGVLTW